MTKSDKVITWVSVSIIGLLIFGSLMVFMTQYGGYAVPAVFLVSAYGLTLAAIFIGVVLGVIYGIRAIVRKIKK